MPIVVLLGYDRSGFSDATCHNMEEVKEYLDHPHIGYVHAYIDGVCEKHFLVPSGLVMKYEQE